MDPNTDALYAGVAGAKLPCDEFALGPGVTLSSTFAHLMSPLMLAFSPAERGKPHPTPWSTVRGGFGFDIHMQVHVAEDALIPKGFDRLNTVWLIAALLRFRVGRHLQVPVIAERPFSDIPSDWKSSDAMQMEMAHRYSIGRPPADDVIDESHLRWLSEAWLNAGELISDESRFSEAFQAFDQASTIRPPSIALLVLWAALEHLFSPSTHELKFRVSSYIAAFLEPYGTDRRRLQRTIAKLYDARSRAAHKAGVDGSEALRDTDALVHRVLERIIADRAIPGREELDASIFGGPATGAS